METRYALEAALADGAAGTLPLTQAGLELSRKGVLVTAFGDNPDGPGTVLRLWEYAGRGGDCRISLPDRMKVTSIQPVDLRGRPIGQSIAVEAGQFRVSLPAFAP